MRNFEGSVTTVTEVDLLLAYNVSNLNTNCSGPVTAIEYCYRYSLSTAMRMGQQITFSWIVLILERDGSYFSVINNYIIRSCGSVGGANCTRSRGQITCCDRTDINGFDLSNVTNFIFGVIASAQENTPGVTLLGYSDSLPQYIVNTSILGRSEVPTSLSMGSRLRRSSPGPRGIRMLWFVTGKH